MASHSTKKYNIVLWRIFRLFLNQEKKKMDEKLQNIFKIRPLQINCIAYRNSSNEYRKMIKQASVSELRNLVNVEMKIEQVNMKMPDEELMPNVTEEVKVSKADCLLNEFHLVEESIKLL